MPRPIRYAEEATCVSGIDLQERGSIRGIPMKMLGFCVAAATLAISSAALAAPMNWSLSGTLAGGGTVSGTFTYDPATNVYSAVNITTTAGTLPGAIYTTVNAASRSNLLVANTAGGTSSGQPVIAVTFNPVLSATSTPRTLGNSEGTCNPGCTDFSAGTRRAISGTVSMAAAPAQVPTMSEWAMILFGTILAGAAALYVQRRQQAI